MLLLHALGRALNDRAWLLMNSDATLSVETYQTFSQFVQRRLATEPVAYITGQKEFFGLTLQVDPRVLDPRADTETLVEWALSCLADVPAPEVVDLGTGSGAIALALKHARPDAHVSAVDASADAWERDGFCANSHRLTEAVAVTARQRYGFTLVAPLPLWPDRVDHPLGGQPKPRSNSGLSRRTRGEFHAGHFKFWASGIVDGSVNTSSTVQGHFGSVDYGVRAESRYVSDDRFDCCQNCSSFW